MLALLPVFGANWLVSEQADHGADQLLDQQLIVAREGADAVLSQVVEDLRTVSVLGSAPCGPAQRAGMGEASVINAEISAIIVMTRERQPVCSVPDMSAASLDLIRDPVNLNENGVALSQVRVFATRMTGILLELHHGDHIYAAFAPRPILPLLFENVAPSTGVVLSLGDAVLYSRDPQLFDPNDRTEIEVRSVASELGAMRVQVSIDENLAEAAYASLRRWVTIGSVIIGALLVMLITRLIQYTPKQINDIERAINNNEFVPYYQPVIDVNNGKLIGCEVLVRWIKPDGTMVSPGAFIGVAEQTGLAVPMTRSLMRTVVRDVEKAYAGRRGLKVAINLFNHHFTNLDIIQDVEEIFGPSSIAYSQLVLEITERAPLESLSQAKVIMRKLQNSAAAWLWMMPELAMVVWPICRSLGSTSSRSTRCSLINLERAGSASLSPTR